MSIKIEDLSKQEFAAFSIWELKLRIDVAEAHVKVFKRNNKHFHDPALRIKGTDTKFYELNLPEWKRSLENSLKQYKEDYGKEYKEEDVKHPTKA